MLGVRQRAFWDLQSISVFVNVFSPGCIFLWRCLSLVVYVHTNGLLYLLHSRVQTQRALLAKVMDDCFVREPGYGTFRQTPGKEDFFLPDGQGCFRMNVWFQWLIFNEVPSPNGASSCNVFTVYYTFICSHCNYWNSSIECIQSTRWLYQIA